MGATTFQNSGKGANAQEVFSQLVSDAQYEHGHGGYSGTIAEKRGFELYTFPAGTNIRGIAKVAMDSTELDDSGIAKELDERGVTNDAAMIRKVKEIGNVADDKWGPAACVHCEGTDEYIFFGWAPE